MVERTMKATGKALSLDSSCPSASGKAVMTVDLNQTETASANVKVSWINLDLRFLLSLDSSKDLQMDLMSGYSMELQLA